MSEKIYMATRLPQQCVGKGKTYVYWVRDNLAKAVAREMVPNTVTYRWEPDADTVILRAEGQKK